MRKFTLLKKNHFFFWFSLSFMINGYNYDVWRRNRRFLKKKIYTKISSLGFNEDRHRNKAQLCTTCNATETKIWRPADKKNRS